MSLNSATATRSAACPYCHQLTVPAQGLPAREQDALARWLAERPMPLVALPHELSLCKECSRLYDQRWWQADADRPCIYQAPCPGCGSRAALTPFVEPARQLEARRRFLQLAYQSLCLFCDMDGDSDPAQACLHCPVEPKLYLCTRCDAVAKWSEPEGQPFRAFELVG